MKTKTYNMKKNAKWRFLVGGIFLLIAIYLTIFNPDFSIGELKILSTLITGGIVLIIFGIQGYFFRKEIKYDERTQILILKSSRGTFAALIYFLCTLMIIGVIEKITIDLATFAIVILFFTIIVFKLFYWYLNKKY